MAAAEAWAIVQAARCACPDSLAVLKALKAGRSRATAHDRPLARIMATLYTYFDHSDDAANVVWLPGHTSAADVGRATLSDGSVLSALDHAMNGRADVLAKAAARPGRACPAARAAHAARQLLTDRYARHLGRVTRMANNAGEPPLRDSAAVPTRERRAVGRRAPAPRPPALGGHILVPRDKGGWACQVCMKRSMRRGNLVARKCHGSALHMWARREATLAAKGTADSSTHRLRTTGNVVWCEACGAYGTERAVGLADACRGPPPKGADWGRRTLLARLRRGLHPRSGEPLGGQSWAHPRELEHQAAERAHRVFAARQRHEHGLGMLEPPPGSSDHLHGLLPGAAAAAAATTAAAPPRAAAASPSSHRRARDSAALHDDDADRPRDDGSELIASDASAAARLDAVRRRVRRRLAAPTAAAAPAYLVDSQAADQDAKRRRRDPGSSSAQPASAHEASVLVAAPTQPPPRGTLRTGSQLVDPASKRRRGNGDDSAAVGAGGQQPMSRDALRRALLHGGTAVATSKKRPRSALSADASGGASDRAPGEIGRSSEPLLQKSRVAAALVSSSASSHVDVQGQRHDAS